VENRNEILMEWMKKANRRKEAGMEMKNKERSCAGMG